MRRIGLCILIVGLSVLGGCSSSTGASKGSGILTGGIYLCGGFSDQGCPGVVVAGIRAKPNPGTVVVSSSGRIVASVSVTDGQSYRIRLQPGIYAVSTGSVPNSVRAEIKTGKTTTANLVNSVP